MEYKCTMLISDGEKYVPIRAKRISMKAGINKLCGLDEERGLFWFFDNMNNIVGIDNATGDMWCEDNFDSIGDCIRWLQREDF